MAIRLLSTGDRLQFWDSFERTHAVVIARISQRKPMMHLETKLLPVLKSDMKRCIRRIVDFTVISEAKSSS